MGWSLCQGGNGGSANVPCICSTGSQHIELPVYGDDDLEISFKMFQSYADSQRAIFADYWGDGGFCLSTEPNLMYFRNKGSSVISFHRTFYKLQSIYVGTDYISVDGTRYALTRGTGGHNPIYLFDIDSRYSTVAISDMKIYKDGDLYMDLIPMQDSQTGEGYYHDDIGNQDYYSNTSTPLIYSEL